MVIMQEPKLPTVFISFAHESEELRLSVKDLAEWLGHKACTVLTDHAYMYRPPAEGWQAWMLNCIARADTVLVVCTPKLKERYEKTAAPDTGRGATYEGAIVTQHIYDDAMRNTKFYPILPDGGSETDIPTFLKSWWNGHWFPSGNTGIHSMILDDPPTAGSSAGAARGTGGSLDTRWPSGKEQEALASRLLTVPDALLFLRELQTELAHEFPLASPQNAEEVVRRFTQSPTDQVQALCDTVRRALGAIPARRDVAQVRRAAEEAAAALYFVAACRLVGLAADATSAAGGYVVHVPSSERIICAIIATALFGGELRVTSSEESRLPNPEYVFDIKVPTGGDQVAEDFERAVYAVVFASDSDATQVSLESGPLEASRRAKLAARIRTIKRVRRASFALVVRGHTHTDACQGFGDAHQIPVMLPATEATTALLGMDADTLLAEIQEFWNELDLLRRPSAQAYAQPPTYSRQGAQAMSSSGLNVHVTGGSPNISISTGDRSPSQAGTDNAAHLHNAGAPELAVLAPLLHELLQAITELSSPKAREALTIQTQTAAAEAAKPEKADPNRIRGALDAIKSGAEVLDDGGKIIALCNKAYQLLAPFLGLPPSPLS